MLLSKHDCYSILIKKKELGEDVTSDIKELIQCEDVPDHIVKKLINENNDVVNFYQNLNKKAHKLIKEILTCDNKPVGTYIKIATSLITQSVITMEHLYQDNVNGQNNFIECMGLKELSTALSEYFKTGDYAYLVTCVNKNKKDIKLILD